LQESIEQIKTEGKNVFVTPDQSVKIYRKKEHKRNNKKENLKAMVEFYQIDYKLKPEDLRKSKTLDAPL
jgi:hypothetical protein